MLIFIFKEGGVVRSHLASFLILVLINFYSLQLHANFCETRAQHFKALNATNFSKNLSNFQEQDIDLLVLGESHGSHVLERLPDVVTTLMPKKLQCAFVEFPHTVSQVEIHNLIRGNNTDYFQTQASFDYVPFLSWLVSNDVKIIPVDDPMAKHMPSRLEALSWMNLRDDVMFENIMKNLPTCEKSVFLVGKHHLTPDLADYTETLGHRLKKELKQKVAIVDLTVNRNFEEEYCSYTQNQLFKEKTLIPTQDLDVAYSLFVSHSFWSDFDWAFYLPKNK